MPKLTKTFDLVIRYSAIQSSDYLPKKTKKHYFLQLKKLENCGQDVAYTSELLINSCNKENTILVTMVLFHFFCLFPKLKKKSFLEEEKLNKKHFLQ